MSNKPITKGIMNYPRLAAEGNENIAIMKQFVGKAKTKVENLVIRAKSSERGIQRAVGLPKR